MARLFIATQSELKIKGLIELGFALTEYMSSQGFRGTESRKGLKYTKGKAEVKVYYSKTLSAYAFEVKGKGNVEKYRSRLEELFKAKGFSTG